VLALGDSLTLGADADGKLHPYADTVRAELPGLLLAQHQKQQQQQERSALSTSATVASSPPPASPPPPPPPQPPAVAVDVLSVPCAGVFEIGCSQATTVFDAGISAVNAKPKGYYDFAVVLVGINDLLRGGRPAAEVQPKIEALHAAILARGSSVLALPPLAAPGFVPSRDDVKDQQRRQLGALLADEARRRSLWTAREAAWRQAGGGGHAGIVFVPVEKGVGDATTAGPADQHHQQHSTHDLSLLDFWSMPEGQRRAKQWDGLHLTAQGSRELGGVVAKAMARAAAAPVGMAC
jgi:lysophospholipase L1-like esterase